MPTAEQIAKMTPSEREDAKRTLMARQAVLVACLHRAVGKIFKDTTATDQAAPPR